MDTLHLYTAVPTLYFDLGVLTLARYAILSAFFFYAGLRFLAKIWPF